MLDFRMDTFLTLCKIKSYTKTAQMLHITQPAVSQHIKYLENHYNGRLFCYENKTLELTQKGKLLREFATTMRADIDHMHCVLSAENSKQYAVTFGATLTIGEYVMPQILKKILWLQPDLHITMSVNNTEILLQKLSDGKIDFALVEGVFDKSAYGGAVFSSEEFIPVCAASSKIVGQKVSFDDLLGQRIILREKGSGTRDIFEQVLCEHNLGVDSFPQVCEIANTNAIKKLVMDGLGITFIYKSAVYDELHNGSLKIIDIDGYFSMREFNFVFLQNSLHASEYLKWFELFRSVRGEYEK